MTHDSALGWLDEPTTALLEIQSKLRRRARAGGQVEPQSAGDHELVPGMEKVITTRRVTSSRRISDSFEP